MQDKTIAVIGLGYVGLPLAVEYGKQRRVIGFDTQTERIANLRAGQDKTRAEQIAEQAQAPLARARAIQKDNPEILFFAGHFARLSGDIQTARQSWQTLLDRLPPTSETARLLQAELDKLAP